MAAESIIDYRKPEFPKVTNDEGTTTTTIEYIGPGSAIDSALPSVGDSWGDYAGTVKSVTFSPTENSAYTDASVRMAETVDSTDVTPGTVKSVSYEIRWVDVGRELVEHPDFAEGGRFFLSNLDKIQIEAYRAFSPKDDAEAQLKKDYKFVWDTGSEDELSPNARLFVKGQDIGQDPWQDKAPVAVKISEYVGGPPPETDAGTKQFPQGVPNIPSGYEWRKETADSTRAGGETRWTLTEEWAGAAKVLIDRNRIYWSAP